MEAKLRANYFNKSIRVSIFGSDIYVERTVDQIRTIKSKSSFLTLGSSLIKYVTTGSIQLFLSFRFYFEISDNLMRILLPLFVLRLYILEFIHTHIFYGMFLGFNFV